MRAVLHFLALANIFASGALADLYVSTTGSDNNDGLSEGKALASLAKAQQYVRTQISSMNANITVRIAPGTYQLSAPLTFTAADSGKNGYSVNWVGAGAVVSGGLKLSNWTAGANGIYSTTVPAGTKSRNLYVNGQASNYARRKVANRKDFTYTSTSIKWNSGTYDWITSTAGIEQAEVRFINSFTDRYAPIQGKGNKELIMKQNWWFQNNWGYDHVAKPNADFGVWVQNALALLTEGGQFYLDSKAGKVYYKPLNGENMATADARLGVLETLVAVGGTYDAPAHDITFQGLSFSHSTWLKPSESGYVDQQTGGYMCENKTYTPSNFESARPFWCQMQSAIQISAASNVVFTGGNFTQLGAGGVGIGNDANAHSTGVGLGASKIAIRDGFFSQVMGNSITAGGVRPDAHHPSDNRMLNSQITISGNIFRNVSSLFSSTVPIFASYVQSSTISHNDVDIAPYSGICLGFGWGSNDAGGSSEYEKRGLYQYQPKYSTPTISKNNRVEGNLIHRYGLSHTDLGALYTLSKSPDTVITENYAYDSSGFGMYTDEGSNSYSITNNVLLSNGIWYAQNGVNTGNNAITGNYGKNGGARQGNTIVQDLSKADDKAKGIADRAGVEKGKRAGRPTSNS
ncbi:hypothetical protein DE146DRAFT_746577 [Phaeosphaeria sp. MPI-PUGE-AT-0046c]|nr:hypothetical protein DE146DRAFT_746577 [Phaeosphaeria sp. MPI-PUGE-AT-0046c]